MTGVSLRWRGREYLAVPGGIAELRAGATAGLPLLAPWANRLASRRYRAAGVTVDLEGLPLGVDGNGLPIHGLLVGAPGWRVDRADTRSYHGAPAGVDRRRRTGLSVPAPDRGRRHRPRRGARRRDQRHPDGTPARCRSPSGGTRTCGCRASPERSGGCACRRAAISPSTPSASRPAPTVAERAEASPIARRTFDDLYALGREPPAVVRRSTTARRSSCARTPPTRTRRCGSRPDAASPRWSRWWRRRTRSSPGPHPSSSPATPTRARFTLAARMTDRVSVGVVGGGIGGWPRRCRCSTPASMSTSTSRRRCWARSAPASRSVPTPRACCTGSGSPPSSPGPG